MLPRDYMIRAPSNPITQALVLIGAAMLAIGAIFIGAIILVLFLGLAVIAGLVFYMRLWCLQRRAAQTEASGPPKSQEYVEAEYTVVRERPASDDRTQDPGS